MKKLFNKKAFALVLCLVLALTAMMTVTAFADTEPADGAAVSETAETAADSVTGTKAMASAIAIGIAAAAKEAESFAQQQRDAARVQADKILSDAKAAAESERQKIVAEANREAVAIAEDAMEKILAAQTARAYDSFVNAAEEEHHEHD